MHSTEVIARLRELLTKSGVPNGDILEEMIDHYLSEIESQIDLGMNEQVAVRTTYQKIAKTDLRNFRKRKNPILLWTLAAIILLPFSYYIYRPSFPAKTITSQEHSVEAEPDGWPLAESTVTVSSKFGPRKHPVLQTLRHHNGIDIKAKIGTPVLAAGAAVVKKIGINKNAGKFIILQHNRRFSTVYYHLSEINVRQNETVTKGSIIGKVGNTGMSTAPHLHYEIKDGGAHIDPLECTRV